MQMTFDEWEKEHLALTSIERSLAELAWKVAKEECARICEARYMGDNTREDMEAKRCAAAIRESK